MDNYFQQRLLRLRYRRRIFGTYEEAIEFANEYLPDYAEQYAYAVFGWNEEYTEEEFDEYREDCGYDIEESEEEEDD